MMGARGEDTIGQSHDEGKRGGYIGQSHDGGKGGGYHRSVI